MNTREIGRVRVGATWSDSKGRQWEAFDSLPFGMFRVRTKDLSRIGEMSSRAIRAHLENQPKASP